MNKEHIRSIEEYLKPHNVRELQAYIGLVSYFRKFIYDFVTIAKPIYDLLKFKTDFHWTSDCDSAFDTLRNSFIQAPVLSIYSPHLETELHCDGSSHGIGAVLVQKQVHDQKCHPIAFFSRRITASEAKFHSFELEVLAIVSAVERFRVYLQGKQFRLVTDCNSLKQTLEKRDINPRIMRWAFVLRNYDYTLEHRGHQHMQHAS